MPVQAMPPTPADVESTGFRGSTRLYAASAGPGWALVGDAAYFTVRTRSPRGIIGALRCGAPRRRRTGRLGPRTPRMRLYPRALSRALFDKTDAITSRAGRAAEIIARRSP